MTSTERHIAGAARRRGELHRAAGDRQVGQIIKARRELATQRVAGRAWLKGELGRVDPRYTHLEASQDRVGRKALPLVRLEIQP